MARGIARRIVELDSFKEYDIFKSIKRPANIRHTPTNSHGRERNPIYGCAMKTQVSTVTFVVRPQKKNLWHFAP
jgi:hypothetical protein